MAYNGENSRQKTKEAWQEMILTCTMNPSLDYFMELEKSALPGAIHRSRRQWLRPGGKGINVALVLQDLGAETKATGFLAGKTGDLFEKLLQEQALPAEFIRLSQGQTRINVKLTGPEETAINAEGAPISREAFERLESMVRLLGSEDLLVVSGSAAPGIPDAYERLCRTAAEAGVPVAADTSGQALRQAIACRPFLIKPNEQELEELFAQKAETEQELLDLARRAQSDGAQNVLVSMGERGAILLSREGCVYRTYLRCPITVRSSVGAGDSMLAGFLADFLQTRDPEHALRTACAAGAACACSDWLPDARQIGNMRKNVCVERWIQEERP